MTQVALFIQVCILILTLLTINVVECQSPDNKDASADTIFYEYTSDAMGYRLRFKTSNGIERNEEGIFEDKDGTPVLKVKGSYQYVGDDDKIYVVDYTADENGYRARTRQWDKKDEPKRVNIDFIIAPRVSTTLIKSLTGAT